MLDEVLTKLVDIVENRYYGKYRGYVTDNQDTEGLGRIKARVPRVLGDVETGWCMPCAPYGGNADRGFHMIPEINAGVWIEFEGGDLSYPIWTGTWWGDPESTSGDEVFADETGLELPKDPDGNDVTPDIKIIKSEKGLMLILDDSAEEIKVTDKDGNNYLTIKPQESKVIIEAGTTIELGDGATESGVFGDKLVQYLDQLKMFLDTHLHTGQVGNLGIPIPPVPPTPPDTVTPPASAGLLSSKVKVG